MEPKRAARAAGLRYVTDGRPGIRRRRCGSGFVYRDPDGERVTDAETLRRIRALAIPPAYRDVWICPLANGHLQATGFDEAGRKQYRYHQQWRECRALHNFDRLPQFTQRLPALRRRVSRDLKQKRLDHRLVVACAVRLLDETLIRIGNQEYYETNGSHGLTTLRDRHIRFERGAAQLRFVGKSGQQHEIELTENGCCA